MPRLGDGNVPAASERRINAVRTHFGHSRESARARCGARGHLGEPNIDATYHLGDLVGYAPWPNEDVERIREREIAGVAGNYDSTVATDYKHCGCQYEDAQQEELSHLSYEWTKAHVTPEMKRFLGALPFRIDLRPLGGHVSGPTVTLLHGTQTLNTVYVTKDRSDDFLTKMAEIVERKAGDVCASGTRTCRGIAR